jgi:hypothetical protein
MIFLGGNPMDTVPKYTIHFTDTLYFMNAVGLDINNDGINDIVITTHRYLKDIGFYAVGDIRIFYGGNTIDTIPDLICNAPKGASGVGNIFVLKDFNGDGRSEFVIYDGSLPYEFRGQSGINYFYNTGPTFNPIPQYTIQGDSVKGIQIGPITSSGDINGDGKTDFIIYGSDSSGGRYKYFTKVFLGNSNFDLTPAVTYYNDSVGFNGMYIIRDVNGDGKDDFLMSAYDNAYPYYYGNSILWGSFPIDTIQDVGLNTQNTHIDLVTDAGDINGDGYNDLFVRTDNGLDIKSAKIWLGGKKMPYKPDKNADYAWYDNDFDSSQPTYGLCRQITAVGDVNGDKVNDICIQRIPYGAHDDCTQGTIFIFRGDTSAKVTSVASNQNGIPTSYVLEEPYPNPFNPSTMISWQLAVSGRITLKVFDITGKEITQLLDEVQSAGKHKMEFNAENYKLSSGVYFLEMKAYKNNSLISLLTKKLTLIK